MGVGVCDGWSGEGRQLVAATSPFFQERNMRTDQTGATVRAHDLFEDMLDAVFGRLEEKQADLFLRRIMGLEKTLFEMEEELIAMRKAHGGEDTL